MILWLPRCPVKWFGAHFTNDFCIVMQIRRKIGFVNSVVGHNIATKFCTCHDSTAVVPCAKYHSDHFTTTWMRADWNFNRIWITMEKIVHEMSPRMSMIWAKSVGPWPLKIHIQSWTLLLGIYCSGLYIHTLPTSPLRRINVRFDGYAVHSEKVRFVDKRVRF